MNQVPHRRMRTGVVRWAFSLLIFCCSSEGSCAPDTLLSARELDSVNQVYAASSTIYSSGLQSNYERFLRRAIVLGNSKLIHQARQNLADYCYASGNYERAATEYIELIRIFEKKKEEARLADLYNRLSNVYFGISEARKSNKAFSLQDLPALYKVEVELQKAQDYVKQSMVINQRLSRKANLASNYNNLGLIHQNRSHLDSAESCFQEAVKIYTVLNMKRELGNTFNNLAITYQNLFDFDRELSCYERALELFSEIRDSLQIAAVTGNLAGYYFDQGNNARALELAQSGLESALKLGSLPLQQDLYSLLSQLYDQKGDCEKEKFYFERFVAIKDTLFDIDSKKVLEDVSTRYQTEKKESQILLLSKQKELDSAIKLGLGLAVVLFSILAIVMIISYRAKQKSNKMLLQQNEIIERERAKSDGLLLNILPEETARELKEKGYADARNFEAVTVLFTDFKGFTSLSESLTPVELVSEIDTCFRQFDAIVGKYGIEKIKTIGDSYMAVGGIPVPDINHAVNTVLAALEIRDFMLDLREKRLAENKLFFEIRIGLHSGPVVAGIVGTKKFAYDVWGDTVNTASRMESSGEPGKVNISGKTWEAVRDFFVCIPRGKIQAKNKGEIEMFFVEKAKPELIS